MKTQTPTLRHGMTMTWPEIERRLYPAIANMLPATQARTLYEDACRTPDGAVMLEIGAYHGLSTCALAYACIGTRKRVYTIDTFCGNPADTDKQDGESYLGTFLDNIEKQGVADYIVTLVGKSEKYYDLWEQPLDLLFIDGNHDGAIVAADVAAFYPFLKRGGILLMHDMFPDSDGLPLARMDFIAGNLARGVKP